MRWFKKHFVQKYRLAETGLPFPWDKKWALTDKYEIQGGFTQRNTNEKIIADTQGTKTRGFFTTWRDSPINQKDIVRDEDGNYYEFNGDEARSDDFISIKIKDFPATKIARPEDIESKNIRGKIGEWLK